MNREWFAQYCNHVSNNVLNRDGQVRFTYNQLKSSLEAVKLARFDMVDDAVCDLYNNILKVMPQVELTTRQETTLILLLLNIHMAYSMVTDYLLKEDPSIG